MNVDRSGVGVGVRVNNDPCPARIHPLALFSYNGQRDFGFFDFNSAKPVQGPANVAPG